jgi:hypothetical protein
MNVNDKWSDARGFPRGAEAFICLLKRMEHLLWPEQIHNAHTLFRAIHEFAAV